MEEAKKKLRPRTPAQTARIVDRGTKILEMRKRGESLRAISAALKKEDIDGGGKGRGFSHEQVRQDFLAIIGLRIEEQQDMLEEIRALTAERLDKVILEISPLLEGQMPETKLAAANVLIRANKEYAELHGAKQPQQLQISGRGGGPVQSVHMTLEEWKREAAARLESAAESVNNFE